MTSIQIERYLAEPRDFRSLAIREFDPHQHAAQSEQQTKLWGIVAQSYA